MQASTENQSELHDLAARSLRRLQLLAAAGALLVFLGVYAPKAGQGFIADDFEWSLRNRVRSVADVRALLTRDNGFYRPVVALSFAANEFISGTDPRLYGLLNVLLAVACAGAVGFLARSIGLPTGASVFAAAVWLLNVHGINMAVLWLSGRTALLLTVAATMSIGMLVRGRVAIALVFFALALFSKEEAILLPIVGAAWLRLFAPQAGKASLVAWLGGTALIAGAYLWARSMTGAMTPATAPVFYAFTFSPFDIARNVLEYADRSLTFGLVVTLILLLALGRRPDMADIHVRKILVACAAWVAGTFAITLFLPVRSSLYVCLPSVATGILAAALVGKAWAGAASVHRRRAVVAALALEVVLVPVLLARTDRWVATARFSAQALADLRVITKDLPEEAAIVLHDDRSVRPNADAAFGTLLETAHVFVTGRHMRFWVEPPVTFASESVRPSADCVAAEVEVRDGRVVLRQ